MKLKLPYIVMLVGALLICIGVVTTIKDESIQKTDELKTNTEVKTQNPLAVTVVEFEELDTAKIKKELTAIAP